jgi:hypothetical protein
MGAAAAAALLAACGTTVPVTERAGGPGELPGPGATTPASQGAGADQSRTPAKPQAADGGTDSGAPGARTPTHPTTAPTLSRATGTVDRTPLALGVLGNESPSSAASALGVDNGNSFSLARAQKALVAALNKEGGLAGRLIKPVYATMDPQASSYDGAFQAACETFTRDHQVEAVVSSVSIFSLNLEQCLHDRGIAHLESSYGAVDTGTLRRYPGLLLMGSPTTERREQAVLETLAATGWLTRSSRIGVVIEDCPGQLAGYQRGLLPTARRLGLSVVETHQLSCTSGFAAAGAQASALQNAQLRFRGSNVDRVVIVSNLEATFLILFAQAAETQGYRPGYALSSAAGAALMPSNAPAAQVANMRVAGWLPTIDTSMGQHPRPTRAYQRCLRLAKDQGLTPTSVTDEAYLAMVCDSLFLLEAMLRTTRGSAARADLVAAQPVIGSRYESASTLSGRNFLSGRHDSVDETQQSRYVASCACFRYAGPLHRF